MKIQITVHSASDGGAFITMDPSVEVLTQQVEAGSGTAAHTYALAAYRAMHDEARRTADQGGYMETGEIPPNTH